MGRRRTSRRCSMTLRPTGRNLTVLRARCLPAMRVTPDEGNQGLYTISSAAKMPEGCLVSSKCEPSARSILVHLEDTESSRMPHLYSCAHRK